MSGVKCTGKKYIPVKKYIAALLLVCLFVFVACGDKKQASDYRITDTSTDYGLTASRQETCNLLSAGTVIPRLDDVNTATNSQGSAFQSALVINETSGHVLYSKQANRKAYPASMTKVLTFLTAMRCGQLSDTLTVSENALRVMEGSTMAGLRAGDQISLQEALYAMILPSGNDAAITIAEGLGGSTEHFAEEMNETAASIGATHTHYVTVNGLHDDNHYTTANDMYLIFHEALKYPVFRDIISSKTHTGSFQSSGGLKRTLTWRNTNRYLQGSVQSPSDMTVVGGKTGTTDQAGACLVLLSKNARGEEIISIIFKADNHAALYKQMNHLLEVYGQNR